MYEEVLPSSKRFKQHSALSEKKNKQVENYLNRTPTSLELTFFALLWATGISLKNSIQWLHPPPSYGENVPSFIQNERLVAVKIDDEISCLFSMNGERENAKIQPTFFPELLTANATPIAHFQDWQLPEFKTTTAQDFIKGMLGNQEELSVLEPTDLKIKTNKQFNFIKNKTNLPLLFNLNIGIVKSEDNTPDFTVEMGDLVLMLDTDFLKNDGQNEVAISTLSSILKTAEISSIQYTGNLGIVPTITRFCHHFKKGLHLNFVESNEEELEDWLISKSQNQFFITIKAAVKNDFCEKLEVANLNYLAIGEVTEEDQIELIADDKKLIDLSTRGDLQKVGEKRPFTKPAYLQKIPRFSIRKINSPKDLVRAAKQLFLAPNVVSKSVSKRWVFQKEGESALKSEACADILPLKGSEKSLVISAVSNTEQAYVDPFGAAMIAVMTAVRQIICAGAQPLSIIPALNFGDLNDPEVYWQFLQTTKGIEEACLGLNLLIAGGDVATFPVINDGVATDFLPRPTIHAIGKLDNVDDQVPMSFQETGDQIYMLGNAQNDLAGSEYLRSVQKVPFSQSPYFEMYDAVELNRHLGKLIEKHIPTSINDVGQGGLFVSLMNSAMIPEFGFKIETVETYRRDAFLFGESQNRVVMTIAPDKEEELQQYLISNNMAFAKLGEVFGNEIVIDNKNYGAVETWKEQHLNFLKETVMGELV
ncbi:MAG: phosphoribosylformylglycinamidine (FGAM) synthase-like enzyme [Paraglaciecola sp.]|jgi:phosphoribosylformylglycinamidine (FGAM) synthase-like enzyme